MTVSSEMDPDTKFFVAIISYVFTGVKIMLHFLQERCPHTYETFFTSPKRFETSRETFSTSYDTFRTSHETFSTSRDTFRTSRETFFTSHDTFGTSRETFFTSPETFRTSQLIFHAFLTWKGVSRTINTDTLSPSAPPFVRVGA